MFQSLPYPLSNSLLAGKTTRVPITIPVGLNLAKADGTKYFNVTKIVRSTREVDGAIYLMELECLVDTKLFLQDPAIALLFNKDDGSSWAIDTHNSKVEKLQLYKSGNVIGELLILPDTTNTIVGFVGYVKAGEKVTATIVKGWEPWKIPPDYTDIPTTGTWEYADPADPAWELQPLPEVITIKHSNGSNVGQLLRVEKNKTTGEFRVKLIVHENEKVGGSWIFYKEDLQTEYKIILSSSTQTQIWSAEGRAVFTLSTNSTSSTLSLQSSNLEPGDIVWVQKV